MNYNLHATKGVLNMAVTDNEGKMPPEPPLSVGARLSVGRSEAKGLRRAGSRRVKVLTDCAKCVKYCPMGAFKPAKMVSRRKEESDMGKMEERQYESDGNVLLALREARVHGADAAGRRERSERFGQRRKRKSASIRINSESSKSRKRSRNADIRLLARRIPPRRTRIIISP